MLSILVDQVSHLLLLSLITHEEQNEAEEVLSGTSIASIASNPTMMLARIKMKIVNNNRNKRCCRRASKEKTNTSTSQSKTKRNNDESELNQNHIHCCRDMMLDG